MNKAKLLIISLAIMIILTSFGLAADPSEGYVDGIVGPNVTRTVGTPTTVTAVGGNITTANFTIEQQTNFWAGFFGNITQFPVLEGGTNNFYSWTGNLAFTSGSVLFSNATGINWNNVGATTSVQRIEEDTALSMTGEVESVNNTFISTNTVLINLTVDINAGTSTSVNTSSLGGAEWETVLLEDNTNNAKIYAGITNQSNENYAGVASDYQVMIPTGLGTRVYYVYIALD